MPVDADRAAVAAVDVAAGPGGRGCGRNVERPLTINMVAGADRHPAVGIGRARASHRAAGPGRQASGRERAGAAQVPPLRFKRLVVAVLLKLAVPPLIDVVPVTL